MGDPRFFLKNILSAVFIFSFSVNLFALDDIDSLFDDPPEDIVLEDTEDIDHRTQFETSDKVSVRGQFKARGGLAAGWKHAPGFGEAPENFGVSPGATSIARLSFNARPDPVFSVTGDIYTEIDPEEGENSWSVPQIGELFCDYIWLDTVFFRLGKHTMTWGQGRLFTPGNLMKDSGDGIAFRASFPTLLDGVSVVSLLDEEYTAGGEGASAEDVAVGAIADKVFGNVRLSAGSRYQKEEGLSALGSFKTVFFSTDLLSDIVLHYKDDNADFEAVAGFFREFNDLKLYGEYHFDGRTEGWKDHSIGLALGYKDIFNSPVDVGVEWKHSFIDDTGSIITGASWNPWKFIKANFGIPWFYGGESSRYLDDNETPGNKRLSFVFFLELSSSF